MPSERSSADTRYFLLSLDLLTHPLARNGNPWERYHRCDRGSEGIASRHAFLTSHLSHLASVAVKLSYLGSSMAVRPSQAFARPMPASRPSLKPDIDVHNERRRRLFPVSLFPFSGFALCCTDDVIGTFGHSATG
jgi:hypothetical protein